MTRAQLYQSTTILSTTVAELLSHNNTYKNLKTVKKPHEITGYLNNKNLKPQPDQCETKTQNWFNDLVDLLDIKKVSAKDTHATPYLCGLKPDISFFYSKDTVDGALIPMFVRTVLEIKPRPKDGASLTDESKGQLIDYIRVLVQQQPLRQHFAVFLSDMSNFYILTYNRNNKQYSQYSTTFTEGFWLFFCLLYGNSVYVKLVHPVIGEDGMILKQFLGEGSSGTVYMVHHEGDPAAAKFSIPGREHALKNELSILDIQQ